MTTSKQFWTLFRFQLAVNPFIYFMLIAFSTPILLKFIQVRNYHPNLDSLLSNQNIFFVGFIGVMLLAPEIFSFRSAANPAMANNGTEFLLTRATDRRLIYRSRILLFYLLILIIPLGSYLSILPSPELKIREFETISQQAILRQVPESHPAPSEDNGLFEIVIGHGETLLQSWHIWMYLVAALATQLLILLVQTFKYGRWLFWTAYIGVIALPLLTIETSISHPDRISPFETAFLYFAAHQTIVWVTTAACLILCEVICERHFEHMEQ